MKIKTKDALHSSGYAAVQNGANFGASSNLSFAERQKIEEERKFVRGYRNSRIASGVNGMPRPTTYTKPNIDPMGRIGQTNLASGGIKVRPVNTIHNPKLGKL